MKKIIFATFLAFVVGNSSCKEEEVPPCGGSVNNSQALSSTSRILKLDKRFFIKNRFGKSQEYLPEDIKVYNAQQVLIPIQAYEKDTQYNTGNISFWVFAKDIFISPAFGKNISTTDILYIKIRNEIDTLRFDSRVKSYCNWDSVGYLNVTQNSMPTINLIKKYTGLEEYATNPIFIQK
jgi:hypothetical protein